MFRVSCIQLRSNDSLQYNLKRTKKLIQKAIAQKADLIITPEASSQFSLNKKKLKFNSNNAGGILGGISSGQEIIVSFAVKPTSSILKTRKTITKLGKNTTISVKGRHDPCVGIRAVPVGEAMLSCVLLDHYLMNKAQCD